MINREMDINIVPTPEELANCFCEMNEKEQALFFNHIAVLTKKWGSPFCFQLQAVTDSKELDNGGRNIMCIIGQYGE